ncbi:PQ_loop repeat-containing protein [Hexamita inflata]|uniref:PQ loop repeat-containing protein n=1 Tax=Hexamita inflata TaxID=28002 RepID=A0AA86QXS3_9EUKA|nr:PQ loop repeat-containing protein [Hexamita inflata]
MHPDPCIKCQDPYDYSCYLLEVDVTTILMGMVLIIGSLLSFIPQIVQLFKLKNTEGLSFQMLHLAQYNQDGI